jgi:oligopeptide/dipeptide ABC transporter ATP-binding protein
LHPYSRMLQEASRMEPGRDALPGMLAQTGVAPVSGCRFQAQCPHAREQCARSEPELEQLPEGREVRCFYWK